MYEYVCSVTHACRQLSAHYGRWSCVCVCARFVYDSADQLTAWRSVLQSSISHALGDDKVPQPNTHRHTTTLALTQTQAL